METIFLEFNLNMQENEHLMESNYDAYIIPAYEMLTKYRNGTLEESADDVNETITLESAKFMESVKQFFENLIKTIEKLITDAVNSIKVKTEQLHMKARLAKFRKEMSKAREDALRKEVDVIDGKRYLKNYATFMMFAISQAKSLFKKKFENVDDYSRELTDVAESISAKFEAFDLGSIDSYKTSMTIKEAIAMYDKEINSFYSVCKGYNNDWQQSMKELEQIASKEDDPSKVHDIQKVAQMISRLSAKVFQQYAASTIQKISTISSAMNESVPHVSVNSKEE